MTGYVLQQEGVEEFEATRLSLVEQRCDPFTIRQLDAIGVGEGWRCLDVGAGRGSVTRLLAERVGSTGSVLAVDLDTRLLEPLASDRVQVRRHDLLADRLPDAAFDLVHARLLLVHLPSRLDALRRLAAAVRPGGWIAIGDTDLSITRLWPSSAAWERTWSAFADAVLAAGWDLRYGARLRADLDALELAEVQGEYFVAEERGGEIGARLLALTVERVRESLLAFGATSQDIDEAERLLTDPSVGVTAPAIATAWGRRAA